MLFQDLNKKDHHQLDLEYQWLQKPVYRTTPKLQEVSLIIAVGETKANRLVQTNAESLIGPQQRKTICMDLLPADARTKVDELIGLGQLHDWQALRQFIVNLSDQRRLTQARGVSPLPIYHVESEQH